MLSKNKILIFLVGIVLVAGFLRVFNLGDWMHYQLDQARDFRIITAAVEYGPGELPLQGPKAAGNVTIADSSGNLTDKTTLRLGPASYYLEYVSAQIFGNTPMGSIVILMLLSVATVPLFYFFLRRFFSVRLSLSLAGLVSVSVYFVTYSRFGWNPNLLPFFMLLLAYSLLRATDATTTGKSRGWWLVAAAFALAMAGQMHFLAFVAAPVIAGVYWIWINAASFAHLYKLRKLADSKISKIKSISKKSKKSKKQIAQIEANLENVQKLSIRISWRYWLLAFAVFGFAQIPLVINDIKTDGENTKAFMAALRGKSDAPEHSLIEKAVRSVGNHAKYYWLINTGDQRAELPTLRGRDVRCDHNCRNGLARGAVALVMMVLGALAWWWLYRRETDDGRRNFLRMVAIWYLVPFGLYLPLAYDMAPRFYLVAGLVNVVALGLVATVAARYNAKLRKVVVVIVGLFIVGNLLYTLEYFSELSRAGTDTSLRIETDYILKEKTRVTFAQMEQIVDYMRDIHQQTSEPVFVHAQAEFKRAFWERLDYYDIPRFHATKDLSRVYRGGNYFLIVRTQSDTAKSFAKILANVDIAEKKEFGTMTIYRLMPKAENIIAEDLTINTTNRDPRFSSSAQVRYLWRQIRE